MVDFLCQFEEGFHKIAILHNLPAVFPIPIEFFTMDIVCTRQSSPLFSISDHIVDLLERFKFLLRRSVVQGINNHPLTNQQISTDLHGRGQDDVNCQTNKEAISKAISHMLLKEGNVKVIIWPFSEVVKAGIKKAIEYDQQDREVDGVEFSEYDQKQVHGSVIYQLEYQ